MTPYRIERIGNDHPRIWTACFQACAVARCRESNGRPWPCDVGCEALPTAASSDQRIVLTWGQDVEQQSREVQTTYQEGRVTEEAAVGVCAACFAILNEGEITEVTKRGSGVDYWVDGRRAVLEVSGIRHGARADLDRRYRAKLDQLREGFLRGAGFPGYVFVILFGDRRARFSYLV